MNTNKKTGNTFERQLCAALAKEGFWAHNMTQSAQGQPFDVLAARNGVSHPIDCKDCAKNVFKLERMEENQIYAMTAWKQTGNGESWFALRLNTGEVYMIPFSVLETMQVEMSTIGEHGIRTSGIPLSEWVKQCK